MRFIAAIVIALVMPAYALAGPSIVGSMQAWDPADPDYDLTLQYWGVYELFKNLPPGIHEYKAVDGDSWGDDFPGANQSFETVGNPVESIWWWVNLGANPGVKEGDEFVCHSSNPPIVVGDMQSELGGSDWDPTDMYTTQMYQPVDMLFKFEAVIAPAGTYQGKIALNNNWDQDTGPNISFSSDGVNPTLFTYDMATNTTTVSTQVVTQQDVLVTFTVCLPDSIDSFFDVCVTGGHPALTNWNGNVVMAQPCPTVQTRLWTVDVLFPAGSDPFVEYKYQKDDCATWESTGNRPLTIDDSAPTQILPADVWEYLATECPDCSTPVEDTSWGTIKSIYR